MVDVICPGCKRKIGCYEEQCLFCGFPIKKYLQNNNINDLKKKIICTRCGNEGSGRKKLVMLECEYCDIPMVQIKYSDQEFIDMYNAALNKILERAMDNLGIGVLEMERMIQKNDPRILKEMINIKGMAPYAAFMKEHFPDTFNLEAFEKRIWAITPRCPKCGSTEVKFNLEFSSWMAAIGQEPVADSVSKDNICKNCGFKW